MAQFKRSIQPGGFRPEQVSTENESRLQEQANSLIRGLRAQQEAVLSNRNLIADSLEKNAQIESQQAAINQNIRQENIRTKLQEQQDLSKRSLAQYEIRTRETEKLYSTVADLSLTASKKLREIEVEKIEQKDKTLAGEILAMGDNHPDVKALKSLKFDAQIEEVAAKTKLNIARIRGADPLEVDEALKRLNGLGYHAKSALLQHVSKQWAGYLSQRFLSDVKDFTDPVTGKKFSGSEAARDPQRNLIVSAQALKDFEAFYGISGQLAALKQETGYYDNIFKVSESYAAVSRNAKLEDNTQEKLADFTFKLINAPNAEAAITLYETEFPGLRATLGNKQALDLITNLAKQIDENGKYTHDLNALENAKLGPNGETFGKYWPDRVNEIKKARVDAYNALINSKEGNRDAQATARYREIEAALLQQLDAAKTPKERADIIATAGQQFEDRYGVRPRQFIVLQQRIESQDKAASQEQANLVLEKIRTGMATQGDVLSIADPTLRDQVNKAYIEATKVRKYGPDYEETFKSIKSAAKQIMGDSLEGPGSTAAQQLNLVIQKNFSADYEKGLRLFKGDTTRALQYASNILEKDIQAAKLNTDTKARYYSTSGPGNQKVFKNVRGLEAQTNAQKDAAMKSLRTTLSTKGVGALDVPGMLGSELELRQISEANRTGQVLIFTPQIREAAKVLNISPIEATNQAIAAFNRAKGTSILPLTLDPVNRAIDKARPATLRLFLDNPTPGRVQRGAAEISGTPLRDPANLRGGSGNIAAFRSAIIGKESGGNYNAVNPDSGALGIGQVMPENVGPWTEKYVGKRLTPQQFLKNPQAQDAVINGRFRDMLNDQAAAGYKGEEAIRRAAAVWYSGRGNLWNNTQPQYYNGRRYPSIAEYTKAIYDAYRQQL